MTRREQRSQKIAQLRREGYPVAQAAAIAYREYGENPRRLHGVSAKERDLMRRPLADHDTLADVLRGAALAAQFAVSEFGRERGERVMEPGDVEYYFVEPLLKLARFAEEHGLVIDWPR